jgi:hypothetical protein
MMKEKFSFTNSRLKEVAPTFKDTFRKLNFSQINNVLMEVLSEKIETIKPSEVLKNYTDNRFCLISEINPKDLNLINQIFYNKLPEKYELLSIPPVAPIGAVSSLTEIDQKTILSTIRNLEIVSDPTAILALESAKRRKVNSSNVVTLATSHNSLRLQQFSKAHMAPYFSGLVISASGQDIGNRSFEFSQTKDQIEIWLNFIKELNTNNNYSINDISVSISDTNIISELIKNNLLDRDEITRRIRAPQVKHIFNENNIDIPIKLSSIDSDLFNKYPFLNKTSYKLDEFNKNIIDKLRKTFPNIEFYFDLGRLSGMGYFDGLLFKIRGKNQDGQIFNLVDGGLCNWTAKLLSNNKEQFIASGAGTDVIIGNFKK